MMSTSSASQSSTTTTPTSKILGGDYAGLSATFSSKSGDLVPVPEHLVPESMIEWGEIPSSFEVLTSEDMIAEELERTTITVLPEVGCGIDNLEVTKTSDKYGNDASRLLSWQHHDQPEREVVAINRQGQNNKLDIETIFQVDSQVSSVHTAGVISRSVNDDEDSTTSSTRRIRVSFSIDMPKKSSEDPTLSKLITLQVERQSLLESSQGTAWSGPSFNSGGLDARSVMNTIGKDIVYGDVFAVKKLKGGGDQWNLVAGGDGDTGGKDSAMDVLEGPWMQSVISPEKDDTVEVHRTKGDFGGKSGPGDTSSVVTTLRLPQNIMVRYGNGVVSSSENNNMWAIEVSHIGTMIRDGGKKTQLQRRVVSRTINIAELEQEGVISCFGDVSYWLEEKAV